MRKFIKKLLWIILCTFIFIGAFGMSGISKIKDIFGDELFNGFALQGASSTETLSDDEVSKEIMDVKYIKEDGSIDTRQIIIYKPANVEGDIPLIYVPHYAIEENTADFVSYIKNGWAAASTYNFKMEYNGVLETDDLVFNNAALYTLRNLDGIDKQRIAIVGGSAGGYTTLMLNELQMGTVASIANAPIVNAYFNFHEYFPACDEINRNSGVFDFRMPIQGMVSKVFQPINDIIGDNYSRWEAVSPISMANTISNPLVMIHLTSDILVPIDQITHKYTYKDNDGTLPKGFNASLPKDYPGILSSTFEEMANPDEISISKASFENNQVEGELPYSDKLITVNVVDDGPTTAKGSHSAPTVTGNYNTIPYLKEMMSRTLKETEKLVPEKMILLLERYAGNSKQLPAHEGVDNSIYGSLEVYQKEVVDELSMWSTNHSLEEMDFVMKSAIRNSDNTTQYTAVWNEIKGRINVAK